MLKELLARVVSRSPSHQWHCIFLKFS